MSAWVSNTCADNSQEERLGWIRVCEQRILQPIDDPFSRDEDLHLQHSKFNVVSLRWVCKAPLEIHGFHRWVCKGLRAPLAARFHAREGRVAHLTLAISERTAEGILEPLNVAALLMPPTSADKIISLSLSLSPFSLSLSLSLVLFPVSL